MSTSLVRARVNEFREAVSKLQEDDSAPIVILTTKCLEDLNSSLQRLLDTNITEQKLVLRAKLKANKPSSGQGNNEAGASQSSMAPDAPPATTAFIGQGLLVSYFAKLNQQNLNGVDELKAQAARLEAALGQASCSSKHWQVCLERAAQILVANIPPTNKDIARRLPAWIREEMEYFCRKAFFPLTFYGLAFPCFSKEEELEQEDGERLSQALHICHDVFQPQQLMYLFKAVVQPIVVGWTSTLLTSERLSEQEFRMRVHLVLPWVRFLPRVGITVAKLFKAFALEKTMGEEMLEWKTLLARYRVVI